MTETDPAQAGPNTPITILMATYNGARFIDAQLQSIAAQTHQNWALLISDDGSTDETLAIVSAFALAHPARDIRIFRGPKSGAAQNFLSLLSNPDLPEGAIAFADQDDVWLPHKLARAAQHLAKAPACAPAGYACLDIATDANLHPFAHQKRRITFASFQNALVQNVMRGNAIVLNENAVRIMRNALRATTTTDVKFHDWWVYLVLTGVGGKVIIDQEQGLFYRQHGENALGANVGAGGFLRRLKLLRTREYQNWVTRNLAALETCSSNLTPENRKHLAAFANARQKKGISALLSFLQSGARWQAKTGTMVMAIQALLGRI